MCRIVINICNQRLIDCSRNTVSIDLADLVQRDIFKSSDLKSAWSFYQLNELHIDCRTLAQSRRYSLVNAPSQAHLQGTQSQHKS
jgi:hypothetical protein